MLDWLAPREHSSPVNKHTAGLVYVLDVMWGGPNLGSHTRASSSWKRCADTSSSTNACLAVSV